MEAMLQVLDLAANYRSSDGCEVPALTGVTFSIRSGEAVGLLGESGCGKSTTALTLLRLLPESARIVRGEVRFCGKNMLELGGRELRGLRGSEVSLIFQEPSIALNPVICIENQVAEVIRAHRPWNWRRCRREAREILAQVHLSDSDRLYRAYPHELSGGQKQRVLIAQALACRPSLVVADEPTTGLDARIQAEILDLLWELKVQHQIAFLFISHHPGVLARLADRVLVMYAGKIVEEGELSHVYGNPLHPYTRGLLQAIPTLSCENRTEQTRRLVPISGTVPDMRNLPRGCPFAPRCPVRAEICWNEEPPVRIADDMRRVRCHVAKP
ncbi:MAG TPA: ABC transporter ATP-binding protein [Acidobacteriota bacterium]|nr:ABC transporter ATP-binding protein [Acidobacteriota bacterium]